MLPQDIAKDRALLLRFHTDVAYDDRPEPSEKDKAEDLRLLAEAGEMVVAWFWPRPYYFHHIDPFQCVEAKQLRAGQVSADSIDLQRARRRWTIAQRFDEIVNGVAKHVCRSTDDVKTHIMWSLSMREGSLQRLLSGADPFHFQDVVHLCSALQLHFSEGWLLVDPTTLRQRIDVSILRSQIAHRLRSLSLNELSKLAQKLPPSETDADPSQIGGRKPEVYRAPRQGGRYSSLYAVLASDEREAPEYTLDEINSILTKAGEMPLPQSAYQWPNTSWWAGTGARAEGRPQVSSWWAAGYRVRGVNQSREAERVRSVTFEALLGRSDWLAGSERTDSGEYRVPGPEIVPIYPDVNWEGMKAALHVLADRFEALSGEYVPEDPIIKELTDYLHSIGEADREEISHHFATTGNKTSVDESWLSRLLTRARRQGWIVNKGTRSRPRWAAARYRDLGILDIVEKCNLYLPAISPEEPVPAELLQGAAAAFNIPHEGQSAIEIAREIVEHNGGAWKPEFESADHSINSLGLDVVSEAIGQRSVWRPEWDSPE